MITNRGYLNGLIHRGVREELLSEFGNLWTVDLHGDSKVGEIPPVGFANENVFDIQQGVAITLGLKSLSSQSFARRFESWGTRVEKHNQLAVLKFASKQWAHCSPLKPNYFFDHAGVRFVVLDSSAKRVTKMQLKWLAMALDVPGRKIVFTHMPPVQLSLWGGVGRVHELGGFIAGSREFADIVSAAHVSRVYMGHVHAFGVQDHGGVRYVLTGGGGSALFPSGSSDVFHHYLTVEITASGIRDRKRMTAV